ncbi:MAG: glycosyltransferase, partial [Thiohalobacteraceae bacterium]
MRDFDPRGSQLVFLISLPRSGSTLLQRILGGHPDIATLAEPWIMLHPLYALKRGGIETEYDAGVARDALDDFLAQIDGGEDAYLEEIRRFAGNLYARALARQGKTRFLDKTPRYYRIIPELQRVFPEAKFVFLLRNPLGVLSSTLHTWFNDDPKRLDGKRNHSDLLEGPALLADGIASLGDAAIVVRYEELVDAPEQVTADLCARLGIDYRPEMIEYGRSPAPAGRFGDQAGVPLHTRPTGASRDKWVEHLRDDSRRGFALNCLDRLGAPTLAALGYADEDLRQALEVPAPAADSLVAAGEAAFATGDVRQALRLFEQARGSGCADAELLNNLMVAHWHNGDAEQALHYLVVALEADPDHRTSVLNGIQILTALGQADEARGLGRRYVARHPDDLEIAEACGITLETAAAGAEPVTPPQPPAPARNLSDAVDLVDFSSASAASARAPKITVVIPSFNQGKYLEQTLRSVFDQNYPNLEVIVMDGGSTDASVEVIRKYADRIAYWQSERDAGQYWAVDAGFRRSTGEIMTWINSDDKLHRGAFNLIASVFMQLPRVEWITGVPNVMNEDGVLQWVCHPPPVFSRDRYLKKSYDYPSFIQQEGTFWRRSLWEKAGACLRTDLRMAGDLELWTRFFRHAPLHTIDTFTGCFRQQRDQKTAKAMDLYRAEADRILDDEIARVRSSGGQVIAPVEVVRLTHRESELRARRSMVARFVSKMFHQERVRLAPASAVLTSGRCPMPSRSMHGGHNAPLVTAIVSTYNSERFIRGCIEDLEAQTLADQLEIIVVDSGSEQNEGVIVGELQQRYGNIKYLRTEERETIYSAWNRGVRAARGKYLTNANTDDRHRPDAFERMVGKLEEHPEVALVYADSAVTHMENAGFGAAAVDAYFRWPDFDARNLFAVCYVGPQPMWRAALHERYGYFDPSLRVAGDYEFWLRLAPHETFLHLPETLGLYLSSPGSIEHAHAGIGAQESELARERHWPRDWGQRPPLGKGYLVPAQDDTQGTSTLPGTGPSGWEGDGPLVSVVIATKDRPQLLECALQSLVRQTYTRWEALVVNDGGTDVAGVIEAVAGAGRIRYLPLGTSIGQAKARNRALREIRGSIVCFLDDDDLYLPEHLQTIVAALGPPQRDVVYTDADLVLEVVKDGTRQELERWTNPYRHDEFSRTRLYADNYIPINTWGIRTDCLRRAGHFDESMTCCEDWDLLLRLSREFAFTHVAQTTVEVRHRANVVDNVTRLRIDETVAAYRRIFSTY